MRMKNVESQAVHVEIMADEAVEFKKNLLEMQLHLLDILKALITVKELRKDEFKLKEETRTKIKEITKEIERMLGTLPVSEGITAGRTGFKKKLSKFEPVIKKAKETKERMKIDAELKDIKRQLEKLG